jgi:hypothetical protein
MVLWAFGNPWGEPAIVKRGVAEVVAPTVRVPVVFQPIPINDDKLFPCELVVYPDQPIPWDKDTHFVAVGIPDWFDTWAKAVGLPLKKYNDLTSLTQDAWSSTDKPSLLILGGKGLEKGDSRRLRGRTERWFGRMGAVPSFQFAADHSINVLVLASDWFRDNEAGWHELTLLPRYMSGSLADLQPQSWAMPPSFQMQTLAVLNRQTLIAGPQFPLVEEIRSSQRGTESLRVVFSYVPWQQQLGRCATADTVFRRLLTDTAKGAKGRPPLDGRWCLLYPTAKEIRANERPVLAAALKSGMVIVGNKAPSPAARAYVLDLRGKALPPEDFFEQPDGVQMIEDSIGPDAPLLILGDKPILDTWKWLDLDRHTRRSSRPGVVWWPDSSLPPSSEDQLRLMQLFTEWNIPLGE